jgi:hypothetical protein
MSSEETDEQVIEIIARCTVGWKGLEKDGKEYRFTEDNAKALYRAYPEIAERAMTFIVSRGNFFGSASGA